MSSVMGVSKQALAIRMRSLGLLEKEYLSNPHEMLNIYVEETIVLKYFKYPGKSDEEIAELIGVTKDNFKKNRQRALKELKSFFEK